MLRPHPNARIGHSGRLLTAAVLLALFFCATPGLIASAQGTSLPDRGGLLGTLGARDIDSQTIVLALGVAVFLGGAHALSPGHGKTVVAAYLVGSRGRVRDAVFLGVVVTATHTASVILIGVLALAFAERSPERIGPYLGFASGLLIVVLGFLMFLKRLSPGSHAPAHHHDHHHPHGHNHGHEHDHPHPDEHVPDAAGSRGARPPTARPTIGALLSLGISGGMAPCPDAIAVILAAIAYRRIAVGLALVLAFSLGLAAVLISIGVLTVLAGGVVGRLRGETEEPSAWFRWLPVASAILVMILGAVIAVTALFQGGVIAWGS